VAPDMWHDEGDEDRQEYAIAVDWIATLDAEEAIKEPGLFANQHSTCRLQDEHTLAVLTERFGLTSEQIV